MAKIFGILTTVALLLSLFVATKNKSRYQVETENVTMEKGRLAISQERLATTQKNLADLQAEIPVVREETANLEAETEEQRATNSRNESQIQAKNTESTRNAERISELQQQINSFGDLDRMVDRLRTVTTEVEEMRAGEDSIPVRKERLDQIVTQARQLDERNIRETSVFEGFARGESRPDITTRIRSIYPSWGFVTLAAGGISGVAGNSTMDVIRDNQIIAKLRITAVEPHSASASIVPGSIAEDVTLAVGDTVIPGMPAENN